MNINLARETKGSQVNLMIISSESYGQEIKEIIKQLNRSHKGVCYISMNRGYAAIEKIFNSENIDLRNFYFIDAISKSRPQKKTKKAKNVTYLSSPSSLSELGITIGKIIEQMEIESLFFDSLSTLLIYNEGTSAVRFVHDLIGRTVEAGWKSYFTLLDKDTESNMAKNLNMFVDKSIRINDI